MSISLIVNGIAQSVEVEPETPLLWVLRDSLKLTGTKYGCGIAQCGACTVLIDARPSNTSAPWYRRPPDVLDAVDVEADIEHRLNEARATHQPHREVSASPRHAVDFVHRSTSVKVGSTS
jgi:hypothetical protein